MGAKRRSLLNRIERNSHISLSCVEETEAQERLRYNHLAEAQATRRQADTPPPLQ